MARALPNASFVAARWPGAPRYPSRRDATPCAFVDDDLGSSVVDARRTPGQILEARGSITLTSSARGRGVSVMRVPAYDPAIGEHAVGDAGAEQTPVRVPDRGGELYADGLGGNSCAKRRWASSGRGNRRGFAKICGDGFGMRVLGYDKFEKDDFRGEYVSLDELLRESDVVSLHGLDAGDARIDQEGDDRKDEIQCR